MKKIAVIISPNWRDYAKKYLADCAKSIREQDYVGKIKIFITDNETTPESFKFLSKTIPEAELVLNKNNDGFAKGVNDALRLALMQGFDYLAVVNIHTVLEPDYLSKLVVAIESDKKIGVVQARMMLWSEREKISSLGNATHFLGFGYCVGYREKYLSYIAENGKYKSLSAGMPRRFSPRNDDVFLDIFYPSGSSMFFRREALETVGLLDEEYWMYNEDQEIGWRFWLAGWRCVLAPQAVLYNKYEFQRSIKKFYWMDRNRIISILICYKFFTLLFILPAFIVMELGLILFSLKGGWFKEKVKVWKYFLLPRTWFYIARARKRNQALRKVKDSDIINLMSGVIWYQEVDDWKLRTINPIFNLYWKICKSILKKLKV